MILASSILPIDGLSLFMTILVVFLSPLILIYSFSFIKTNLFRYYSILFVTLGGILGAVLARDFLSFYIFLGIMMVSNFFLIIHNGKEISFKAGFKYIIMTLAGGLLILIAILLLYNLGGTFAFSDISKIAAVLPASALSLIFAIFSIGCLVEAGAVPLHTWLPDAHPAAPSPISALLSGITIKIGAYGIIRMFFTVFKTPPAQLLTSGIILAGVLSMLFGVVAALKQTDVKRLLAYHSISQMGYILLGIGIGSGIGLAGGIFHILNHATFKILLFLCMGAVIYATGQRELSKLGGLGRRMPVTLFTFCIAAMAISGIPPFNGFFSKAMISQAVSGNFILKFILVLTTAGTFASFFKLFRHTFLGKLPEKLKNTKEAPLLMLLPMLALTGACFAVGIFPQRILNELISPAMKYYTSWPAIGSMIVFNFWNVKVFVETFLIISLGIGIYILGLKTGLLGTKKEAIMPSFVRYLSLDKIYCDAASLVERGCEELKKLHERNINTHLLWVFLALLVLLVLLS